MIFNAPLRSVSSLALFAILFSVPAFSDDKTDALQRKQASECIAWMVDGVTRTALQMIAKKASPATEHVYPLPYVLTNLGLSEWIPTPWRNASQTNSKPRLILSNGMSAAGAITESRQSSFADGTSMLSLGEGRGGVVPLAVQKGLKAFGLDPMNDPENGSADKYLAKNWMQSLAGDARDLKVFEDQSQQLVVSHGLLTQLDRDDRLQVLRESFRVLKVTGTARHSILIPNVRDALGKAWTGAKQNEALLVQAIQSLVRDALGDTGYQVAVFIDEPQFRIRNSNATPMSQLFDLDVTREITYRELREETAELNAQSLNLLIVLRRPDTSWFSSEGWLGI